VVSTNGFNARATASRIRSTGTVDSTPLAPLAPASRNLNTTPAASYATTPVAGPALDETGMAVTYCNEFVGQPTATGEIFAQDGMTAAHPSLPLPSLVQVVNVKTGAEVVVRVNDRGPFEDGAMLQVSDKAANVLGFDGAGRANVRMRYLGPAPVQSQVLANQQASAPAMQAAYDVSYDAPRVPAVQPSAPVKSAAPSMSFGDGHYYVQVGSFSDIGNAQSLNNALSSGLPVEIKPARVNGADYFRVRVGPMDTRASADALRDHLAEQGIADGRVISDQ
jgi:rare lipoprotein A